MVPVITEDGRTVLVSIELWERIERLIRYSKNVSLSREHYFTHYDEIPCELCEIVEGL